MDTGTHFVMGVGLAGLAHLDPTVASIPMMSTAVAMATIIGSQAPDFDMVFRIKGNSTYIRKHRGASHSLPAILLYGLFIGIGVFLLFPEASLTHLFIWTYVALGIHVFTDLLNGYGTQAFRPLTEKWISWNILHIFDSVIFLSHLIGIGLWLSGYHPGYVFASIYTFLGIYICWLAWVRTHTKRKIVQKWNLDKGKLHLFPTYHPLQWNLLYYGDENIQLGEIKKGESQWLETFPILQDHPVIEIAKKHPDIQNFLYFSRYAHVSYMETEFGYEVRWVDLRYRHKKHFPLLAILYLNRNMKPIGSYVGWSQEEKVKEKLRVSTTSYL